jgi:hypothetical protein
MSQISRKEEKMNSCINNLKKPKMIPGGRTQLNNLSAKVIFNGIECVSIGAWDKQVFLTATEVLLLYKWLKKKQRLL